MKYKEGLESLVRYISMPDCLIIEDEFSADYLFKSHRHSYTVISKRGGSSVSGGYGHDNEILFPTIESALIDSLKYVTTKDKLKELRREIILEGLL